MWRDQLAVFCEECDFETLCSISWLLLINHDADELCWWILTCNWRRLWLCMHVLKIVNIDCWWLVVEHMHWLSHMFMHSCCWCRIVYQYWRDWILYLYWRWRILYIHIGDDYDTDVSKVTTLRWPVPHAYISRV